MKSLRRTAWGVPVLVIALPALASAATITVNSVSDAAVNNDGACTLREAIIAAKTNTASGGVAGECGAGVLGLDDIEFNITTGCDAMTGVCTIQPTSALPAVDITTDPVFINGYTQPGAVANSLAVGTNAALKIEIDGINAGLLVGGLLTISGGNSTVRGLVINRAQGGSAVGLYLTTVGGNTVAGNYIGVDPTGTTARSNGCQGLGITSSSTNTIGGVTPADRNVIAGTVGCGHNLLISNSNANHILNNYIGLNAAGTAIVGGGTGGAAGISLGTTGLNSATANVIGGSPAAGNVISGNAGHGINITGDVAGNLITGNFIGTNASGTAGVANGLNGIRVDGTSHDNLIGETGAGNLIAFNLGDGVNILSTTVQDITIFNNSIHSNGGLGIDLGTDGVTANDLDDPDTGGNGLQNFPVITAVTPGAGITTIEGTLNSNPSTQFLLQFFSNSACDPSGNGEGQTFLGNPTPLIVTTDASGDLTFSVTVPTVVSAGQAITGTATTNPPQPKARAASRGLSPLGLIGPQGATSEFSACFVVGSVTATPTATPSQTPTPTTTPTPGGPSPTPTLTPSLTATLTPTVTLTPTSGPSPTPTLTPSTTPSATPSLTPTSGPSPTPTLTPSTTPSLTPTLTPSITLTPSQGPSPTPTLKQTVTPTGTPTPTLTPSNTPIVKQTLTPTPTLTPSATPTNTPPVLTSTPTATPTVVPPSATPTVIGGGGPAPGEIPVPTLSEGMLALLALALAGVGYFLIRRG